MKLNFDKNISMLESNHRKKITTILALHFIYAFFWKIYSKHL